MGQSAQVVLLHLLSSFVEANGHAAQSEYRNKHKVIRRDTAMAQFSPKTHLVPIEAD
jgi:hypothetical protein